MKKIGFLLGVKDLQLLQIRGLLSARSELARVVEVLPPDARAMILASLFGGASKQDEGLEMLGRAANLYKMAKKWNEAGQTFSQAGDCSVLVLI